MRQFRLFSPGTEQKDRLSRILNYFRSLIMGKRNPNKGEAQVVVRSVIAFK